MACFAEPPSGATIEMTGESDSRGTATPTTVGSWPALTVIKERYSPTLSPQYTTEDDVDDLRTAVLDEQTVTLLAGVLGTPYPLDGG